MTSTDMVRSEIVRFLRSPEPEVICITGEWGVGKTYTWQTGLDQVKADQSFALTQYSYASLFGINSLESLKLTLFENFDFLDSPPDSNLAKGVHYFKSLTSKAKRLNQLLTALPYVGQVLSKAGPLYFSLIRNQIVCIDDLERRGRGLDLKDVFGLVSFLREQRACKVVLLLNEEALAEDKADFDTYFEKVVDARLVFSPTAAEATQIALPRHDSVIDLLRRNCEALKISNIRVIKKIERLVLQVAPHLKSLAPELTQQAVHSLTLFGWSKFQPKLAPPIDFYRVSYTERYFKRRANKTEAAPEEEKWSDLLTKYNFGSMDEFDRELMKFVDTGVLDISGVTNVAIEQNRKIELQKKTGSLEMAFRPFHDSFDANVVEVTRSIVDGLKANIAVASLSNLDAAVALLKQIGKESEAKEVLAFFVDHQPPEYWESSTDPFQRGPLDADVAAALTNQKAAIVKPFDAEAELIRAGETYDSEAIKRLAEVPIDEFYTMIKSKKGDEMRKVISSAIEFRRISNASPEMLEVVRRVEEALKRIGSESILNAARVQRYGVTVDDE